MKQPAMAFPINGPAKALLMKEPVVALLMKVATVALLTKELAVALPLMGQTVAHLTMVGSTKGENLILFAHHHLQIDQTLNPEIPDL